MKYYRRMYERQSIYEHRICSLLAGRVIRENFCIIDLKNGSSSLLTPRCYSFMKITANLGQDYYPETLGM